MRSDGDLDRRSFLIAVSSAAAGLTLGFAIPFAEAAGAAGPMPEITCWIAIAPDDTVIIRIARSEMGQGALTGLAMLVAEELECDWSKVRTEFVSPTLNLRKNRIWGDTSTGASRSIASSQDYLRRAGATAREMLIAAAAAQWRVPPAQCVAAKGAIVHRPSGRTLSYAAIRHCPVFRGRLKSVDANSIAEMAGVRGVVRMPDAVAVVADSWWRAERAADALAVTWDDCGNGAVSTASIAAFVRAGLGTDT